MGLVVAAAFLLLGADAELVQVQVVARAGTVWYILLIVCLFGWKGGVCVYITNTIDSIGGIEETSCIYQNQLKPSRTIQSQYLPTYNRRAQVDPLQQAPARVRGGAAPRGVRRDGASGEAAQGVWVDVMLV